MKSFQRGDTVLEVIIVIACLSLVLTVSLGLVNRNTAGVRLAQERGEASKIGQAQIEQYKALISSSADVTIPPDNSDFCMKADGSGFQPVAGTNFADFDNNPSVAANCKKKDIYYTHTHRAGNTYTVYTRWSKLSGPNTEQVISYHRVSPIIY